jgi:hypothetical protein
MTSQIAITTSGLGGSLLLGRTALARRAGRGGRSARRRRCATVAAASAFGTSLDVVESMADGLGSAS